MDENDTPENHSYGRRTLDKEHVDEIIELALLKALDKWQAKADTLYAPILVKVIVYGFIVLILEAVVIAGLMFWLPTLAVK